MEAAAAVERTAPGDAQHGAGLAPLRPQRLGRKGVGHAARRRQALLGDGGNVGVALFAGRGRGAILVAGEVVDEVLHGFPDARELRVADRAAFGIVAGELQPLHGDIVVIGDQRAVLQQLLGEVVRLVGIAGEEALIEVLDRRQRRPVTEQHVEELEVFDMAGRAPQAAR